MSCFRLGMVNSSVQTLKTYLNPIMETTFRMNIFCCCCCCCARTSIAKNLCVRACKPWIEDAEMQERPSYSFWRE